MKKTKPKILAFENKLFSLALAACIPPALLAVVLLIHQDASIYLLLLIVLFFLSLIGYCLTRIRQTVVYQLRTLTNLMEAMLHADYSIRGRHITNEDALGELMILINKLAAKLQQQKFHAKESSLLLSKVINQIDVAIIIFNDQGKISLANPAAIKLFCTDRESLVNSSAQQLGLTKIMSNSSNELLELPTGEKTRNLYVRCNDFFEKGKIHKLILITDIHRVLREEERQAWQNLLRVLSHEINNSLAPIASISDTLIKCSVKSEQPNNQLIDGLSLIKRRAGSLNSFIQSYQDLAKLPKPNKKIISLFRLLQPLISLFGKRSIILPSNRDIELYADPEQLEQLFVNLLKNADEAMDQEGAIQINWQTGRQYLHITIKDQGPGISNFDNLFVPFYTTKKKGSGIGLTLARQIMHNHNGELSIQNRTDSQGVEVIVKLPHSLSFTHKYSTCNQFQ